MNIRSGLPYNEEEIAKIYEEGATVNLAKVAFPTMSNTYDNMKAAITYLRNTGYNVELDFSEMTYEQKSELMKAYLDTKVAYNIDELNTAWLQVFYACCNFKLDTKTEILNELEIQCFISNEKDLLLKWADFIISLPLFLVTRLDVPIETTGLEVREDELNLTNFINIIKHPSFEFLMLASGGVAPKNYTKLFTMENNELFEAISTSSFGTVLTGMVCGEPEKFVDFLKTLSFGEVTECQE